MDTTYWGPLDAALQLNASQTKTATFNGVGIDLKAVKAARVGQPVAAFVDVTARDFTTTDETYTAVLEESDDNSSFAACGPIITISAVGKLNVPGFLSKRYARLTVTLGGTTPSLTYQAWIAPVGDVA